MPHWSNRTEVLKTVLTVNEKYFCVVFICNTGEIRSCVNCLCLAPIHRCSFVGIQCVTEFGFIAAEGEATDYYQECLDGYSTIPQRPPQNYKCKDKGFVLATTCDVILPNTQCDFCDLLCVNEDGSRNDYSCTDHYATCADSTVSISPVPEGYQCPICGHGAQDFERI